MKTNKSIQDAVQLFLENIALSRSANTARTYKNALNAFLIFSTNIVCLNIAGIITFYLAGIRPGRWWEMETAKKKTRSAFILWALALMLLIITIMLFSKFG